VRRFDVLQDAVRRVGAGKILFGSDGPWLHPGLELAKVGALRLSARDEALVLAGNIARLMRREGVSPLSHFEPDLSVRPVPPTERISPAPWHANHIFG
jgi:uncharacterized protein